MDRTYFWRGKVDGYAPQRVESLAGVPCLSVVLLRGWRRGTPCEQALYAHAHARTLLALIVETVTFHIPPFLLWCHGSHCTVDQNLRRLTALRLMFSWNLDLAVSCQSPFFCLSLVAVAA